MIYLCMLLGLISIFWFWAAIRLWPTLNRIPQIKNLTPPDNTNFNWPSLTIAVTARNEERDIEQAVRSLLDQDYPQLRVLAVDDDSSDRTGDILDAIQDARFRVLHIKGNPPQGWLGKNWAMHQAVLESDCDYILFTDGDVKYSPGVLKRAIWLALQSRADHIVVFPRIVVHNFLERCFLLQFTLLFLISFKPWEALNPKCNRSFGIGAFNMVRRQALLKVGGLEKIRSNVEDDVALGRLLKENGGRFSAAYSNCMVRVRWQDNLWGMIKGLEKNIYASSGFRLWPLLGGAVFIMTCGWMPFIMLIIGLSYLHTSLIFMGLLCVFGMLFTVEAFRPAGFGAPAAAIFSFPMGSLMLSLALLNSVYATWRQGGIRWRDRFYSMDDIKTNRRDFPVF